MVRPLELELNTYERERGRLEDEHRGKFVLIRGERIAGIFDHFHAASQHAARQCQRESYLIHCIGAATMRIPSGLLDGLAAMGTHARARGHRGSCSPSVHLELPACAGGGRLKS